MSPTHRNNSRCSKGIRNLQSASYSVAKYTGRTADRAVSNLIRHVTKPDRSPLREALDDMPPSLGFLDTVGYMLWHFMIAVAGAFLAGAMMFILIAIGIPWFITGHFQPLTV